MKGRFTTSRLEPIWEALLNKYYADPGGFRDYLPEVARELERLSPSQREESRSVLTDMERERYTKAVIQLVKEKELSAANAIQALEYCATLVRDESLPFEITRDDLLGLIRKAAGIPVSKVERATTIPVCEAKAVREIALLRGVRLHLTWDDRLVAISIFPAKAKERSKALKFVGITKDSASDVALRHDVYLAEGS